jgi:DNA polymerase III subunit epsilon
MILVIDFETANHSPDSACSLGLVVIDDLKAEQPGSYQIVHQEEFWIRPPTDRFVFTPIHGITWNDVQDAPTFGDHWRNTLGSWFKRANTLVAHNVGFDARVLKACAAKYGVELPELKTECTVQLSRNQLKISPANLKNVSDSLGIALKHHDAMSDARAAAYIYIHAKTGAKPWI